MPLIFQKIIVRADLVANARARYLFGDNVERKGMGGQAQEMRGEFNAIGIPTKWSPGMAEKDFFRRDQFDEVRKLVEDAFKPAFVHARHGGVVVCPSDGLGTGLAQLRQRCPELLEVIRISIVRLRRL